MSNFVVTRGPSTQILYGDAPDVQKFMAGHLNQDTDQWEMKFYWDLLGQLMQCDFYCTLPAVTDNFTVVRAYVKRPGQKWQPASDPIPITQFNANGEFFSSFGVAFNLIPSSPEGWVIRLCSANKNGEYKLDSNNDPMGPSITLQTLAPSSRPLSPPDQISTSDYTITVDSYQHDDQTGQNYAQMQLTLINEPASATVYSVYGYPDPDNTGAPTDPHQWGDSLLNIAKSKTGATTGQFQILRSKTAVKWWFAVTVRTEIYNTQPWAGMPVKSLTINSVSMPQNPTNFSVSLTRTIVQGVDTGVLVYTMHLPSDTEIAFLRVDRIQCDDPATHGGSYVPESGAYWVQVWNTGVDAAALGTQMQYQHQYPWDATNLTDSWWIFRIYSQSRANMSNDSNPPAANLYAPARLPLDISAQLGQGLQWVQGKASVKVGGNEIALDSNYNLIINRVAADKLLPNTTIQAGVVFAGTLAANVAYFGHVGLGQLTAGTAIFDSDVWFYRGAGGPYVQISSNGLNLGSSANSIDMSISASQIVLSPGGNTNGVGSSLTIKSDSIILSSVSSTSLGRVTISSSGELTSTNIGGFSTTINGNQVQTYKVILSALELLPIGGASLITIDADVLNGIPVRHVLANSSFLTGDGKTATVTQGLITDIT